MGIAGRAGIGGNRDLATAQSGDAEVGRRGITLGRLRRPGQGGDADRQRHRAEAARQADARRHRCRHASPAIIRLVTRFKSGQRRRRQGQQAAQRVVIIGNPARGVFRTVGEGGVGAALVLGPVRHAVAVAVMIHHLQLVEFLGPARTGDDNAVVSPVHTAHLGRTGHQRPSASRRHVGFEHLVLLAALRLEVEHQIGARTGHIPHLRAVARIEGIGAGNRFNQVRTTVVVFIPSGIQSPGAVQLLPDVAEAIRRALTGRRAEKVRGGHRRHGCQEAQCGCTGPSKRRPGDAWEADHGGEAAGGLERGEA